MLSARVVAGSAVALLCIGAACVALTLRHRRARNSEIARCAAARYLPTDPQFGKPTTWLLSHNCYEADVDSAIASAKAISLRDELLRSDSLLKVMDSTAKADSARDARALEVIERIRRRWAAEPEQEARRQAAEDRRGQYLTDSFKVVLQAEAESARKAEAARSTPAANSTDPAKQDSL